MLWQNRQKVLRCKISEDRADNEALGQLLKLFFSFERPEIAGFRAAVEQFKTDLPAVRDALRQMIERAHAANASFRQAEEKFLLHAQEAINLALSDAEPWRKSADCNASGWRFSLPSDGSCMRFPFHR